MPRTAPALPTLAIKDEGGNFTASAMLFTKDMRGRRRKPAQLQWQSEAWDMYDTVPEFRSACNWVANVASLAVLKVGKREGGEIKTDPSMASEKARQAIGTLGGGQEGQEEIIRQVVLHFSVVGECYYIERSKHELDPPEMPDDITQVLSAEEVESAGKQWYIKLEGGERIPLQDDDLIIRMWRPHPRRHLEADAPAKAALPALREVRRMDAHVESQQTSRLLAGRVLAVPSEIQMRKDPDDDRTDAEILTEQLGEMMRGAVENPGDPDNLVPTVFSAPAETLAAIRLIDFWGALDEKAQAGREKAINRVAVGMDIPTEIITGMSDMNRWGTWQIEESSVKIHISPALRLICGIFTMAWLRPFTQDPADVIYADTSSMRIRPNRSKEAIELFNLFQLSPEALVRETGFSVEDLPDEKALKQMILLKMITASWSPDQAQAAATMLGIDLGLPLGDNAPRQARPDRNIDEIEGPHDPPSMLPGAEPPDMPPGVAASATPPITGASAVVKAMACQRAMERAGARLRTLSGKRPDIETWNTHTQVEVFPDRVDDLLSNYAAFIPEQFIDASSFAFVYKHCSKLLREGKPFDFDACLEEAME